MSETTTGSAEDSGDSGMDTGIGALLRASRQRVGEDLRDVAHMLRIRYPYLEAIEDGRFNDLPGQAYAVGFVRAYADHLGLDSEEVVRRFKDEASGGGSSRKTDLRFPTPVTEASVPGGALVFIGLLIAVLAYGAWYISTSEENYFADLIEPLPDRLAALVSGQAGKPETPAPAPAPVAAPQPAPAATPQPAPAATPQSEPGGTPQTPKPVAEPTPAPTSAAPAQADTGAAAGAAPAPVSEPQAAPEVTPEPTSAAAPQAEENTSPSVTTVPTPPEPLAPAAAPEVEAAPSAEPAPDPAPVAATASPAIPPSPATSETPAPEPSVSAVVSSSDAGTPVASGPAPEATPDADPAPSVGTETAALPVTAPADPPSPAPATPDVPPAPADANAPPSAPETDAVPQIDAEPEPEPEPAKPVSRVVLRATGNSWIQVKDDFSDEILLNGLLTAGEEYHVPNKFGLRLLTGNAGALEILVDGDPVPPIGEEGAVKRGVQLDPALLKAGTAAGE